MEENNNQNSISNENQTKNDNTFKNVVSTTGTTYSSFESNNKKEKKNKSGNGFGKTVVLPFACGILGAGLVIGTCFGVPSIRNELLAYTSSAYGEGSSNTATLNTEQISLLDYSDTAVGVAQKVLPSIVGINVTLFC